MSNGWISCKDRLPTLSRDGEYFLVFDNCRAATALWRGGYFDHTAFRHERFTHWRELPSPPPRVPTKDEALREAEKFVAMLPDLDTACDLEQAIAQVVFEAKALLPRLRAALGDSNGH